MLPESIMAKHRFRTSGRYRYQEAITTPVWSAFLPLLEFDSFTGGLFNGQPNSQKLSCQGMTPSISLFSLFGVTQSTWQNHSPEYPDTWLIHLDKIKRPPSHPTPHLRAGFPSRLLRLANACTVSTQVYWCRFIFDKSVL